MVKKTKKYVYEVCPIIYITKTSIPPPGFIFNILNARCLK